MRCGCGTGVPRGCLLSHSLILSFSHSLILSLSLSLSLVLREQSADDEFNSKNARRGSSGGNRVVCIESLRCDAMRWRGGGEHTGSTCALESNRRL